MGGDRLSGKKKYTNGKISKFFFPGEQPSGWVLGCTDDYRKKSSAGTKRTWCNSEYREKQKAIRTSSEFKERSRNIARKSWMKDNTDRRIKISSALKTFYSTEEGKEVASKRQKKTWQNQEYREKQTKLLIECHKDMYREHPEYREKLSTASKKNWEANHEQRLMQQYVTKSRNNSWNTSSLEENFFEILKSIYPESDIFRQYKDPRYPFYCDFYVKSEDWFIEIQGSWVHGKHPYDANDPEDIATLEQMKIKAETSDFYKSAIKVWTITDPLKMKTAKENNLKISYIY